MTISVVQVDALWNIELQKRTSLTYFSIIYTVANRSQLKTTILTITLLYVIVTVNLLHLLKSFAGLFFSPLDFYGDVH